MIVAYIAGAVFSIKHFQGRDTVFGIKVARQTTEKLTDKIIDKVDDYQLVIETRDGMEIITADEIKLQFSNQEMIEQLLKDQRKVFWFAGIFSKSEDIPIQMAYDEALMEEKLSSLVCLNEETMIAPVDAHLEFADGSFYIEKEVMGNTVDVESTKSLILEAVLNGEEVLSLEETGCYQNPVIYEDHRSLDKLAKDVNQLVDVTITYDFKDRSEVVDGAKIASFITFDDDFTYELSQTLILDYIKELGKTYDTFGLTRQFRANSGRTVTLKGGDYGWVIDKEQSAQALYDMIVEGTSKTVEPIYRYTAKERATNDIGDTYIEVSIAQQWMWCYVDGVCIVDTPVVTGTKGVEDRETPKDGVWAIDAKMTDYYLVGEDYNSHVDYWLPFNGNVGVHDADWREMEEFGGQTYVTNGSHGCVNTPYYAAKKIYENVTIGTPVVVY